mgnify:CR=1 FL=1
MTQTRGFSLIETLLVLAITGMLMSGLMASVSRARAEGREAIRRADLKKMETMLELYRADNYKFPITSTSAVLWYSSEPSDGASNNNGDWIPGFAPKYLKTLPRDPLGGPVSTCGNWQRAYLYRSNGSQYKLIAHCNMSSYPTVGEEFYDPVRPTWAIMVCSGEEACTTW